jgi:hypothetical protein
LVVTAEPTVRVGFENEYGTIFGIIPNPFENSTNVKFYLVQDADVQITLLDLLGRELKTLNAATLNAGDYNIELNTNNEINTGIYLLKVRVNGIEKVEKVIIK